MNYSTTGSLIHGITQARILPWLAISFSKGSSQPREWTCVSRIDSRGFFTTETSGNLITEITYLLKSNSPFVFPHIPYKLPFFLASLVAQLVKKSACNVGCLGSIPELGRSSEEWEGYPLQYSGLENSTDSPWGRKKSDAMSDFYFTSLHLFL